MGIEAVTSEIIDGVEIVVHFIKYSNGMRVRRTYHPHEGHIDSEILEGNLSVQPTTC